MLLFCAASLSSPNDSELYDRVVSGTTLSRMKHDGLATQDAYGGFSPIYTSPGCAIRWAASRASNASDTTCHRLDNGSILLCHGRPQLVFGDLPLTAEQLLSLFRDHPSDGLALLRGHFAIVYVDYPLRRLMCARSHLGRYSLYYHMSGGAISIASQLGQLLAAHSGTPMALDEYIPDYLAMSEHGLLDTTPYRYIFRVVPGTSITFRPGHAATKQDLPPLTIEQDTPLDRDCQVSRLRQTLIDSTTDLVAPYDNVVLHLSGGRDSSTLAFILSQIRRERRGFAVSAETWWYPGLGDERIFARSVAARHHIPLREVRIDPNFFSHLVNRERQSEPRMGVPRSYKQSADSVRDNCSSEKAHPYTYVEGIGGDHLLVLPRLVSNSPVRKSADYWKLAPIPSFWCVLLEKVAKRLDLRSRLASRLPAPSFSEPSRQLQLWQLLMAEAWGGERDTLATHRLYPFVDQAVVETCLGFPTECLVADRHPRPMLHDAFAAEWPNTVRERFRKGETSRSVCEAAEQHWQSILALCHNSVLASMGYTNQSTLIDYLSRILIFGAGDVPGALRFLELEAWLQEV